MAITIETPADLDQIEYFASFAPAFVGNVEMRAALLGVCDSLRQALLVPLESLGMLACLTAEEEAATFLYYALLDKRYLVPVQDKLRRHPDKVKVLILAQLLIGTSDQRLRLRRDGRLNFAGTPLSGKIC